MPPRLRQMAFTTCAAWVLAPLFGCTTNTTPLSHSSQATQLSQPVQNIGSDHGSKTLTLDCPIDDSVPIARYVGTYLGIENEVTPKDYAQDLYCADQFKGSRYPNGFVTVYGSSRIREHNTGPDPVLNAANDKVYAQLKQFAHSWTARYGRAYPIMTGAGPGLMEAASRGAIEVGPSVGYTTYYDPAQMPTPSRPYGGNPAVAFWKYQGRDLLTDGLIFSSIAMRETSMILHSAAIIIAPGGTGTEWETFEILETIKSKQLANVPIYVVGARDVHWKSLDARLADMVDRGTIRSGEATAGVEFVNDPMEVVERLRVRLGLD